MNNNLCNRYYGEGSFWGNFFTLESQKKGYALLFLLTIMPLTYKLFSPLFIVLGFGAYTNIIMPALYIIGLLMSFNEIKRYINAVDLLCYILFGSFIYISQLFYPLSENFLRENFHDFILYVVPFYFLGLSLDYSKHRYLIHCATRVAMYIHIFWQLCMLLGLVELSAEGAVGEQMDNAYSLLFIVTFLFFEYRSSHMIPDLLLMIVGLLMILFMEARGPLVVALIFFATYFIVFEKFTRNNLLKKIVIFLLAIIGDYFITPIMLFLSSIALQFGYSSNTKVFNSILESSMFRLDNSSGRDEIYGVMLNAIRNDASGFGYGFGSDRHFSLSNGYAHNFELEILVQFGLIGGGLILLILFLLFFKSFTRTKGMPECVMWFILFCWGFLSLQFSMSWIIRPAFFLLLGYCVSLKRLSSDNSQHQR